MAKAGPDVWWVAGKGALLADGIATDVTPFGYVVNLCRENRPTMSIDRNKLEGWNKDWVRAQLRAATALLPELSEVDFVWLQHLSLSEPLVAQQATSELLSRAAALPADLTGGQSSPVNVGDVGVWPFDAGLLVDLLLPLASLALLLMSGYMAAAKPGQPDVDP